jgi:hypothetical protein
VLRLPRRESRKAQKIARVLALLDEQARLQRPAPKRVARLSLGA